MMGTHALTSSRSLCRLAASCKHSIPTSSKLSAVSQHYHRRIISTTGSTNMASSKLGMADRMKDSVANVWVTFTELARTTGAVNLGQGFPD